MRSTMFICQLGKTRKSASSDDGGRPSKRGTIVTLVIRIYSDTIYLYHTAQAISRSLPWTNLYS